MKHRFLPTMCLTVAWPCALAWAGQAANDPAASPRAAVAKVAPAASQTPGVDPFIKDRAGDPGAVRGAAVANVAPAKEQEDPVLAPVVLTLVHEVFSMDQQTLLTVLTAHPDGPQRYAHVRALLAEKKAVLENLAAITTRSGQRCKLQSVHEFRYPVDFHSPDAAAQISRPISYETRHLGDTLEFEPTLGADGETIDVTLDVEEGRFLRWSESGLSQRGAIAAHPVIASRQISTQRTLTAGKPSCVGTFSPHPVPATDATPGAGASASIAFLTVKIPSAEERRTTPLTNEANVGSELNLTYTFYSMERSAAWDLLTSRSAFAAHDPIALMVEAGTARFERVLELPTRSGNRSKAEEHEEITFPTEFAALTFTGAVPGAHAGTAFESRFTGCTIEQEPTMFAGNLMCDMTIAPEFVRVFNFGPSGGIADLWPKLPVFETRRLSTSLSAVRDRATFFGTFNFPRDTGMEGAQDDGRVWLGFVKASSPPR